MVDEEHRDRLPDELDVSAHAPGYSFPDVRRRIIPAVIYLVVGLAGVAQWVTHSESDHVLVNKGLGAAGVALIILGGYHLLTAWRLVVQDGEALVAAVRAVGFPVGHASAQLGWRGLRSRPTWRILLYSAEDPPARRGLVMVDGVDGSIVGQYVEDNPEDWTHTSGD